MSDIGKNVNTIKKLFSVIGKWIKRISVKVAHKVVAGIVRFHHWVASEIAYVIKKLKRTFTKQNVVEWFRDRINSFIVIALFALIVVIGINRVGRARENAITYSDEYEAPEATADLSKTGDYVSIAKNDKLELLFCETNATVQIRELGNGYIWKSIVDDTVYDMSTVKNAQLRSRLQSAISITYLDQKNRDLAPFTKFSGKDCGYMSYELIENGVSVTYGFLQAGIYVTVEYLLDGDNFVVRVPYDKIEEYYKFALSSVDILPYFGACGIDNEGYLFYPDGSGAVTTFAKVTERNANVLGANYYQYSPRESGINALLSENFTKTTASIPVCGIKNGEHAFFEFASDFSEEVGIKINPYSMSNTGIHLNTANMEIYTRNIVNTYNGNVSGVGQGKALIRMDKNLLPETKELRFAFFSGEDANYSGMARYYRDYLLEKGILEKSSLSQDYALSLGLLMATKKEGILFDEDIKMTDFDDAVEILERLKEKGIDSVNLTLDQWGVDYERYKYWKPSSTVGGTSGLNRLSKYAAENGINVFLTVNELIFSDKTPGVNSNNEAAVDFLDIDLSFFDMDGTRYFFSNPLSTYNRSLKLAKQVSEYSNIGLCFFNLGYMAYVDYNEEHPYTKNASAAQYRKTLEDIQASGVKTAICGQNQYALSGTDYIDGIADDCYGQALTDYAVPFIQMVISGYIPYSSSSAGNLSYDLQLQKLKWIEFGDLPTFYLTYESALNLRDSYNDTIFSSTYSDWEDTLVEVYCEMSEMFSQISGKQMVEHKVIKDDVAMVRYENGVTVYINYTEEPVTADGVKIPAKDYVVLGGAD